MIVVRNAETSDAERILEIYGYYVENTAVTFEYETPTLKDFKQRIDGISRRYPYLVILKDDCIVGYAYADKLGDREAYSRSCEASIYVDKNFVGCGFGKKLYDALEEALKKSGMTNIYACVAYPTESDEYLTTNSAEFHLHLGYEKVGEFHNCGFKFDRWYNVLWFEKFLVNHGNKSS